MARRILLLLGIIIVIVLAAILGALATSGHEQGLQPDEKNTTGFFIPAAIETQYTQTIAALNVIATSTQSAAYTLTISACTQQAALNGTQTAAAAITLQTATAAQVVSEQTAAASDLTLTYTASNLGTLAGTLRDPQGVPLIGVNLRLYRDDGDHRFAPFAQDPFLVMIPTGAGGSYDFGLLDKGGYWLEVAYYSLPEALRASIAPDAPLVVYAAVTGLDAAPVVFTVGPATPTPTQTPTQAPTPSPAVTAEPSVTATGLTATPTPVPTATLPPILTLTDTPSGASFSAIMTLTSTPEPGLTQLSGPGAPTPFSPLGTANAAEIP